MQPESAPKSQWGMNLPPAPERPKQREPAAAKDPPAPEPIKPEPKASAKPEPIKPEPAKAEPPKAKGWAAQAMDDLSKKIRDRTGALDGAILDAAKEAERRLEDRKARNAAYEMERERAMRAERERFAKSAESGGDPEELKAEHEDRKQRIIDDLAKKFHSPKPPAPEPIRRPGTCQQF